MATVYTPPGVSVEELTSPSVTASLANPTTVCLVGVARGYQLATQQVVFPTGTNAVTLTLLEGQAFLKVGTTQTFVSAKDAIDPTAGATDLSGYDEGDDFTATVSTDKRTVTVTPVTDGALDTDGGTVNFVYRYVPNDYFEAIRLDSLAAIESRFGSAYSDDLTGIGSPLSYAAAIAFENGASDLALQPLFVLTDPAVPTSVRLQPDATAAAAVSNWDATFRSLRGYEDINIIVPIVGQSATGVGDTTQLNIIETLQDHINFMKTQTQYIIGVVGEDSSKDIANATATTLRNHATVIRGRYGGALADQMVYVSPSRFTRVLPSNNSVSLTVGGQYVAAAIAGMVAARPVTATLTRKQVNNFNGVSETRTLQDKNADASAGLMVIEQKGLAVQVRHAITTSNLNTASRELSVVRAKHRMIESIFDVINTQIIGEVPADNDAPTVVRMAIAGVLELLATAREIVDYSDIEARTLDGDPTVVEARFSYRPAFPLNYVHIVFSIDLTSADLTVDTSIDTATA
jgi:hypothetical protein